MIEAKELERLVEAAIPGAQATARDLTGSLDHYELMVVAAAFAGKNPVERHRMVYGALTEPLKGPLHAVTIKARTPEEAK
jgi:stress-induced morphogen